ncbi:hypothetical protein [Actinocatenispora sera]|uniref:hypothetical protein n=1 Tax=Actinocatenispora sera TaxID=390989 RepID=UPI001BB2FE8E|nr:hypothetical protein [Actinocatenispora sera]
MDELFDLDPGAVLTRGDRAARWGGGTQRGIEPSTRTPNVFLYADPAEAGKFGYVDGWAPGGDVFLYTGEGSEGDQQLQQGNLSLLEHRKQGRALRLFIAASGKQRGGKLHRYVGEFEVDHDSPCAQEDAPDALGETRSVWVFRLRPVGRSSIASRMPAVATSWRPVRVPSWWLWNAWWRWSQIARQLRVARRAGVRLSSPSSTGRGWRLRATRSCSGS